MSEISGRHGRRSRPAAALLVGALVGALALFSCESQAPEEALRARAQGFWDAKVAEDWPRAYTYLEPEWREQVQVEEWIQGVVGWHSAEVVRTRVQGRRGGACVRYEYEVLTTDAAGEKGVMQVEEPWIRVKGAWYRKEVPRTMRSPMEALGWDIGQVCEGGA